MTTDSGWAWVVLAACSGSHFLNGILAYFVGVVHAGLLRKFQSSVTTTAWVGAIYISLMALGAPLASVVISRFGCRVCCVVGGVLCFTGFTASAFVTSIEQLFFTYGLLAGLGLSFTYSPTNITMGFYFHKCLGLASGIAGGCGAVGILSGSLIVQTLIEEFSISGAFLLTGALSLHHSLFALFYRPTRYEGKVKRVSWTVEAPQVQEEKHGSTFSLALHGLEVRTPSLCSVSINEVNTRLGHTTEQEMPLLKTKGKDGQLDLKTSGETCAEGQSAKSVVKSTGDLFDKQKERTTASTENIFHISRAPISNKPGNGKDAHTQTSHSFENGVNGCTKKSAFEGLHGVCSSFGGFHGQQSQGHTENRLTGSLTVTDDYTSELVIKCDIDRSGNLTHKTNSPRSRVHTMLKSVNVHLELFTNKSFLLHCAGFAAANIHISGTQLHLPEYAMQNGTTPTQAAALFVAVGTLCFVSRLCSGIAVTEPQIDALTLSMGMMGICGLTTLLFPLYSGTYSGQMTFSALFGLYSGGLYSMVSVLTVQFVDVRLLSAAYGVKMFFMGVGVVTGPPLAALIVDFGGSYEHSFIFLGCMMMLGSLLDLTASFFYTSSTGDVTLSDVTSDIQHSGTDVASAQVTKAELGTISSDS